MSIIDVFKDSVDKMNDMRAEFAVNMLNEALVRDGEAVSLLVGMSVPCNDTLAEHETICVTEDNRLSAIGLINGILGIPIKNGKGPITAVYSDDGKNLLRFERTKE